MTVNAEKPATPVPTWKGLPAAQQPSYPDQEALRAVVAELEACPPLVFAG
ncbi:3-deoxy-7-phosphoheptulonate synthase, partial [Streptomyces sp. NPDC047002]